MKILTIVLCLCSLLVVPASADELRLKNGDRFTGELIKLDAGTATFKTPFGEIKAPWADIVVLTTEKPLVVTVTGSEPRLVVLAAAGEGRVALREGAATVAEVALADIAAITPPTPPLVISGGINGGLQASSGNTDVSSTHVDGQLIARRPSDRYTFEGVLNRATDKDVDTARNYSGSARYDRFLTKRLFVNGSAIFTNDRLRDLKLRTALGAGIGYQVWQSARGQFSVDGGPGWVDQNFYDAADTSYTALREASKLDVVIVPNRVDAFHYDDLYFGVTGDDNLFFRMQNGVRMVVAARVVATVQYALDYDRSPSPGRRNTDRSTAFTIGYKF